MRTAPQGCVSRILGQTPPGSLCGSWEVFERLAGDVAFQAAHDLACGEAFCSPPPDVVAGLGVAAHPGQHDLVERSVGVPVSAMIQPDTAAGLARSGRDW